MTAAEAPARADLGISKFERVEAVLRDESLYRQRDDHRDPTRGGRPRTYPLYVADVVASLTGIWGSTRAAFTELHYTNRILWNFIRDLVVEMNPNDPHLHLPDDPPTRTWYHKQRDRTIEHDGVEELHTTMKDDAIEIAQELDLCSTAGGGSPTHPAKSRMIYGDGKVVRPLFNAARGDTRDVEVVDRTTGEITIESRQKRFDPDARSHVQGDKRTVIGNKIAHIEVRGEGPYERVTLDVDMVPDVKGEKNSEADILLPMFLEATARLPGAQGVITDGVLRGKHIDQLQHERGIIVMGPVAAKRVDKETGIRTEKEWVFDHQKFEYPDGTSIDVPIVAVGGRLHQVTVLDDGTRELVPLVRTANLIRERADGTYRCSVVHAVADPRGGARQIRRDRTGGSSGVEGRSAHSRAENIRQIAPGDPDYTRVYPLRSDSESNNRGFDDDLYLRRAHSVGAKRQLYDAIAHFRTKNALARHLHRKRQAARAAAA